MRTLVELAGYGLVAVGLWMMWPPLAVVAVGLMLVAVGNVGGS